MYPEKIVRITHVPLARANPPEPSRDKLLDRIIEYVPVPSVVATGIASSYSVPQVMSPMSVYTMRDGVFVETSGQQQLSRGHTGDNILLYNV